jgi:hypothetical protein
MKRAFVMALLVLACLGCGRSKDNAAGFDDALRDIDQGVSPRKGVVSKEYEEGYREVIDTLEQGVERQSKHAADRERAQKLHQQIERKR